MQSSVIPLGLPADIYSNIEMLQRSSQKYGLVNPEQVHIFIRLQEMAIANQACDVVCKISRQNRFSGNTAIPKQQSWLTQQEFRERIETIAPMAGFGKSL